MSKTKLQKIINFIESVTSKKVIILLGDGKMHCANQNSVEEIMNNISKEIEE